MRKRLSMYEYATVREQSLEYFEEKMAICWAADKRKGRKRSNPSRITQLRMLQLETKRGMTGLAGRFPLR